MMLAPRQRIAVVALSLVLSLAACRPTPQPVPTATLPAPTPTPQPAPTATPPPPTPTSMATPAPTATPIVGLGLDSDDVPALLAAVGYGPLPLDEVSSLGGLRRLEATSPDGQARFSAILRGTQLLCFEAHLVASSEDTERAFAGLLDAALPRWPERSAWLHEALSTAEPDGAVIQAEPTEAVRISLVAHEQGAALALSELSCTSTPSPGELWLYDPTLGTGLSRQALQWSYEGLPPEVRLSFSRSTERMGQPAVVGTSQDSLGTLTLVGPEEELVLINLSLAVPTSEAETQAVALAQRLMAVALPNWGDGPAWAEMAVRTALAGQVHEQRRQGLRVLARPAHNSEQLVEISVAAIQPGLPPPPAALTVLPGTQVAISGLPDEQLACLTIIFYREAQEVARVVAPTSHVVSGPEADEVLIEGDLEGVCPWQDYWVASARLPVTEGEAAYEFAPIAP
ncbi:MAG: hypothetical protein ACOX3S_13910 [Anaerolineae bacterium]